MDKIEQKIFLVKKNKCRQIKDKYVLKILDILKINEENINLVDTKKSYLIREEFRNKKIVNQNVKQYIYLNGIEKKIVEELKQLLKEDFYVFIDHDWEYCGAVYVKTSEYLNNDFSFGKCITDDIIIIDKNQGKFILVDYYEMENKYYIDLTITEKTS